jgi:peptide/nickel transport system substrate-binding protein
MAANDVVTTFEGLVIRRMRRTRCRRSGGVLSPGNTEAPDDATVVFHLDAPNGNFPTLVSSANYNAIIIPADLDPADWGKTFDGTGPFKLGQLHAQGRREIRSLRRLLGREGEP